MQGSSIEKFGEKMLGLLERLYLLILDYLIRIAPFLQKITKKINDFDRKKVYPLFEKKSIEMNDYTVFKLQLFSAFFLILTTLFIINSVSTRKYLFLGLVSIVLTFYILFTTVKKKFRDFKAYRDFFLSYYLLAILLAAVKMKKPLVSYGFPLFHFAIIAVVGALAIYLYFNGKYSRDFTFGRVISKKGVDVEVKLNYDIRSNVKPQITFLRNSMHAKEGDVVKVRVKKEFLALRGSTPLEIMGVEWS
jgi:uncharacterized membrane protein